MPSLNSANRSLLSEDTILCIWSLVDFRYCLVCFHCFLPSSMRDSSNWKLGVVYQKMKRKLQCSQGNTQGPERSSDYYSGPSGPSEPEGAEGTITVPEFSRNRNKTFSLDSYSPSPPGFSDLPTALLLNYCLYYINWKELLHWRCLQYVFVSRPSFFSYVTAFSKGFFLLPSFGLCCRMVVMYFWPFPPFYFLW